MLHDTEIPQTIIPNSETTNKTENQGIIQGESLSSFMGRLHYALKRSVPNTIWVFAEINEARKKSTSRGLSYYQIELIEIVDGITKATVSAKIWSQNIKKVDYFEETTGIKIDKGIKVLVNVSVGINLQYGLNVEIVDIDPNYTLGDVVAKKNNIIKHLKAINIFDKNRLLVTPADYFNVIVVSPANAAGLGDFKSSADLLEKFNLCKFTYYEATFQSKNAPQSIVSAIEKAMQTKLSADVVVLIRGGGAVADLYWLNDESLAKYICMCPIPVFLGIGHEKDSTIIDEIANKAFGTPSKVIEFIKSKINLQANSAVDNWNFILTDTRKKLTNHELLLLRLNNNIQFNLNNLIKRMNQLISNIYNEILFLQNYILQKSEANITNTICSIIQKTNSNVTLSNNHIINLYYNVCESVKVVINKCESKISYLSSEIRLHVKNKLLLSSSTLSKDILFIRNNISHILETNNKAVCSYLSDIQTDIRQSVMRSEKEMYEIRSDYLYQINVLIKIAESQSSGLIDLIRSHSPNKILKRGYTFIKKGNKIIKSANDLSHGDKIRVVFQDGLIKSVVTNDEE